MPTVDESPNPIAYLMDDVKDDGLRFDIVRGLSRIARHLGVEQTRNVLIPFLSQSWDKEDEPLTLMAEELEKFIPYVGGVNYAYELLRPLGMLCRHKQTFVRAKAVESLCKIGSQMRESDLVEYFIPLVETLAAGESPETICGLVHIAYPCAPEMSKTKLRSIYSQFCESPTLICRRSAASNLGQFAATVEYAHLEAYIMPIFKNLAQDGDDSVRLLAVEGCASIGKLLEPSDFVSSMLPIIVDFSEDTSCQVRCMVTNQLYQLCEAIRTDLIRMELVRAYWQLVENNEVKVRVAAAREVTKFCSISQEFAIRTLPYVMKLLSDPSHHVRSALASVITGMAQYLAQYGIIEELLPILCSLLRDESPVVVENIISTLDEVIAFDQLSQSLSPAIVEHTEGGDWSVRLAIIKCAPLFASPLHADLLVKLCSLCGQSLHDEFSSIRNAAARSLKCLAEKLGPEWAKQYIVPQVVEMVDNPDCPYNIYRSSILYAIYLLVPVMSVDITCSKLLPVVIAASNERSPEVKVNVAKVLETIIPKIDPSVVEKTVRPCLVKLAGHYDDEVHHISKQLLERIDTKQHSSKQLLDINN